MARSQTEVAALINGFLEKEHLTPSGSAPVAPDTDLIESKILDSLSLVRLVVFLEDELGTKIPLEDVVPDNFASVGAMASYLVSRLDKQS